MLSRLRWIGAFAFPTLTTLGCVSSIDLAQQGQLWEAFAKARHRPEEQPAVAAAIVRDEAPVLTIEAIEGEELAKLVGPSLAWAMDPVWVVLRGTLKTRARTFPYARFKIAVGTEDAEVPSYAIDRQQLAAITREKLPKGHTYTRYGSPICDNPITCLLLWPVVPFTMEKRGEGYSNPSAAEYEAAAPLAAKLLDALGERCDKEGSCVLHVLLRRPRRESKPLRVRVRIGLSHSRFDAPVSAESSSSRIPRYEVDDAPVSARVTVSLPPGPKLSKRFPLVVDPLLAADAVISIWDKGMGVDNFCTFKAEDAITGSGHCLVDLVPLGARPKTSPGLAPPPRPPALGTLAESEAARPYWAGAEVAVFKGRPPAIQGATTDTELLACNARTSLDAAWVRLGPARRVLGWPPTTFTLSPLHLPNGGSLVLEVGHTPGGHPVTLGTITLTRRGDKIVASELRAVELTCVPWDRDAVNAEVEKRWRAAVEALDRAAEQMAAFRFDAGGHDFGADRVELRAARDAIAAEAALAGWDDPRVSALVTRAGAIEAVLLASMKASFTAWAEGKPTAGTEFPGFSQNIGLRLRETRCEVTTGACAIEAEATGFEDPYPRALHPGDVSVVLSDGRVVASRFSVKQIELKPGESMKVTITAEPAPPPSRGAKPFALVVRPFNRAPVIYPSPTPR